MQAQELPAADVAATAAISGVASIPLILLFGALADRLGRRPAFAMSSLLAALGVALQIGAVAPWQFWLAATLLLAANCASNALGAALAADIVSQAALGGAMARYTGTASLAAVISFAGAGYAFAHFGPAPLFTAAALLGLAATALTLRSGRAPAARPVAPVVVPGGD
jgi:MFS family permease